MKNLFQKGSTFRRMLKRVSLIYVPYSVIVTIRQYITGLLDLIQADVILYNMGKTGSQSLFKTLTLSTNLKVHNTYFLSGGYIKHRKLISLWNENKDLIKKKSLYSKVVKFIISKKKVRIITVIRDPYKRSVSHFFEILSILQEKYNLGSIEYYDNSIEKYYDLYINKTYFQDWFEYEFMWMMNLNLGQVNFDKEKKYGITKFNNVEILIIDISMMINDFAIVNRFLELDSIELLHENNSKDKWYKEIYSEFIQNHKLNNEENNKYYNHEIVKHFYW